MSAVPALSPSESAFSGLHCANTKVDPHAALKVDVVALHLGAELLLHVGNEGRQECEWVLGWVEVRGKAAWRPPIESGSLLGGGAERAPCSRTQSRSQLPEGSGVRHQACHTHGAATAPHEQTPSSQPVCAAQALRLREEDVLDLGVVVHGVHAELAADAAALVAAERRLGVDAVLRVHADSTPVRIALSTRGSRGRGRASRPSRTARTRCRSRCGSPPPRRRTGSRTRPARRSPPAPPACRCRPRPAPPARGRTRPRRPPRRDVAAGHQPRALLLPDLEVVERGLALRGRDHRPDLRRLVERGPDPQRARCERRSRRRTRRRRAVDARCRLRAQQSCPAFPNTAIAASSTARSMSPSANTRFADLPPSSSETR